MEVIVRVPKHLLSANLIEIQNKSGGLVQYTIRKIEAVNRLFFPVDQKCIGQKWNVLLRQKTGKAKPFARSPMENLFTQTITVPAPKSYSSECMICFEEVGEKQLLTRCGHVFCSECFWSYASHGEHVQKELHPGCAESCAHSNKIIRTFPCPTCKAPVYDAETPFSQH